MTAFIFSKKPLEMIETLQTVINGRSFLLATAGLFVQSFRSVTVGVSRSIDA